VEQAKGVQKKKEKEALTKAVAEEIAEAKAARDVKKAANKAKAAESVAEAKAARDVKKAANKAKAAESVATAPAEKTPAEEKAPEPEPVAEASPAPAAEAAESVAEAPAEKTPAEEKAPEPEPVAEASPAPAAEAAESVAKAPAEKTPADEKAAEPEPVAEASPDPAAAPAEKTPAEEKAPEPEPVAKASPAPAAAGGAVTPKTIKALRDATGAGMMDCKKALIECDGDQEVAADVLRKKGLAQADKKASRVAAEGKIAFASDGNKAVMVEVNCETDFVGRDSSFVGYCEKVATAALNVKDDQVETLMNEEVDGETLETTRQAMVAKIGENIQVRRLQTRGGEGSTVGCYVHMNRIGVMVEIEGGDESLAQNIAMHVAAMNPRFATADEVPADVLEKEKKLLSDQALESGKPAAIVEKMVEGRIRKYLEEICLVSQSYVRDGDKTVGQLLEASGAKMIGFTRIEVGEGIEKKEDDFAAEVAKMSGVKAAETIAA
jgi:elongation factor Ts